VGGETRRAPSPDGQGPRGPTLGGKETLRRENDESRVTTLWVGVRVDAAATNSGYGANGALRRRAASATKSGYAGTKWR